MKYIIFKKLIGENFLSIGKEIEINLNKKGIIVISGINKDKNNDGNGVGKSAIVDLFYWVLFGETLKDLKVEQIVNNLVNKNCKGTLEFDINNNGIITSYKIERGIKPSFCKIFENNIENKTLSTISATNEYIQKLISCSPIVFRHTITMGINNSIPFMALRKNEKRDFIESIIQLDFFKKMLNLAKEEANLISSNYNIICNNYENLLKNKELYLEKSNFFEKNKKYLIEKYLKEIENYENELKNLNKLFYEINNDEYNSIVNDLKKYNDDFKKIVEEFDKLKILKVKIEENNNSIKNQIDEKKLLYEKNYEKIKNIENNISIEKVENDIKNLNQYLDQYKKEIYFLENENKNFEKEISIISSIGLICDKCKRPYDKQSIEENNLKIESFKNNIKNNNIKIQNIKNNINELNNKLNIYNILLKILPIKNEIEKLNLNLDDNLKKLLIINNKFENITKIKNELEEKIKTLNIKKEEFDKKIEHNKNLEYKKNYIIQNINNLKNNINIEENRKNEFKELLIDIENKLLENKNKIDDLKNQIEEYDIIKLILSDQGVKAYIIKKLLNILNERIKYYLNYLNSNCKLYFNEFFEETIINDRKFECSYHNFSGGERKRIDLAILFAFMDLRRIQGDVSFNVVFYDELLDSAISKDCSKLIFEILKERLNKYNETSFIITHRQENLKNDYINEILWLEKENGFTKIKKYIY